MRHPIRSLQPSAQKVPAVHATKKKLLATVMALMAEMPLEAITADHVLKHSGVSKGSLYHHYADFSELVEDGLVHDMAIGIDQTLARMTSLTHQATSSGMLLQGLHALIADSQSQAQRPSRLRLARILAHAENNERLARTWSTQQQRLTDGYAALFAACQDKGWLSRTVEPHAVAVLVQALGLGQVIDDGAAMPVGPALWNSTLQLLLNGVLSPSSSAA